MYAFYALFSAATGMEMVRYNIHRKHSQSEKAVIKRPFAIQIAIGGSIFCAMAPLATEVPKV
jgi:hypothetical protein